MPALWSSEKLLFVVYCGMLTSKWGICITLLLSRLRSHDKREFSKIVIARVSRWLKGNSVFRTELGSYTWIETACTGPPQAQARQSQLGGRRWTCSSTPSYRQLKTVGEGESVYFKTVVLVVDHIPVEGHISKSSMWETPNIPGGKKRTVVRRGIEGDTKIGLEQKEEVDLADVERGEYNQNTL